jgi:aspartate/methionine/tyrosine aminotransferase
MAIHKEAQENNSRLRAINPMLFSALSYCGKRAFFPRGIPFQAAQSKSCRINATIGQITDGMGNPLLLAPLAERLVGLTPRDVFLYSPVAGRDATRKAWHEKHLNEDIRMATVALPMVTMGVCHAISMGAELFINPDDTLIIPDLHWDNYEQVFNTYMEAKFAEFPFYNHNGGFNLDGLENLLSAISGKIQVLLNFPSNPNGYSPTTTELYSIAEILVNAARHRPVVVYCDDAYHGLVFDQDATKKSLFFELLDRSPNLIPLKCDGITKELSFFGGRVGFLSFGVAKEAADILLNKCMGLMRSRVGSPVCISQHLTEIELSDPRHDSEFERLRLLLADRYAVLKSLLTKPSRHWKTFPFNSGCFCLLKLRDGLKADEIRQRLISEENMGVVSHGDHFIRIAFCSIDKENITQLIEALNRVCENS